MRNTAEKIRETGRWT